MFLIIIIIVALFVSGEHLSVIEFGVLKLAANRAISVEIFWSNFLVVGRIC